MAEWNFLVADFEGKDEYYNILSRELDGCIDISTAFREISDRTLDSAYSPTDYRKTWTKDELANQRYSYAIRNSNEYEKSVRQRYFLINSAIKRVQDINNKSVTKNDVIQASSLYDQNIRVPYDDRIACYNLGCGTLKLSYPCHSTSYLHIRSLCSCSEDSHEGLAEEFKMLNIERALCIFMPKIQNIHNDGKYNKDDLDEFLDAYTLDRLEVDTLYKDEINDIRSQYNRYGTFSRTVFLNERRRIVSSTDQKVPFDAYVTGTPGLNASADDKKQFTKNVNTIKELYECIHKNCRYGPDFYFSGTSSANYIFKNLADTNIFIPESIQEPSTRWEEARQSWTLFPDIKKRITEVFKKFDDFCIYRQVTESILFRMLEVAYMMRIYTDITMKKRAEAKGNVSRFKQTFSLPVSLYRKIRPLTYTARFIVLFFSQLDNLSDSEISKAVAADRRFRSVAYGDISLFQWIDEFYPEHRSVLDLIDGIKLFNLSSRDIILRIMTMQRIALFTGFYPGLIMSENTDANSDKCNHHFPYFSASQVENKYKFSDYYLAMKTVSFQFSSEYTTRVTLHHMIPSMTSFISNDTILSVDDPRDRYELEDQRTDLWSAFISMRENERKNKYESSMGSAYSQWNDKMKKLDESEKTAAEKRYELVKFAKGLNHLCDKFLKPNFTKIANSARVEYQNLFLQELYLSRCLTPSTSCSFVVPIESPRKTHLQIIVGDKFTTFRSLEFELNSRFPDIHPESKVMLIIGRGQSKHNVEVKVTGSFSVKVRVFSDRNLTGNLITVRHNAMRRGTSFYFTKLGNF
uniref:Major outer capsid protein n=1 Tax=Mudumu virus TaxID=2841875 RepID=A0A8E8R703_9REOV|nr:major outer capsid protein [Mudumu virus]